MHSPRGGLATPIRIFFGLLRTTFTPYGPERANLQRGWTDLARCIRSWHMENLSGTSGYVASTLVLLTFVAKDMRLLRTIAIFSNLAFIAYGTIEWLPPVLFLHLVLLPLNIVRLAEFVRATRSTSDLPQPDGVVG